MSNFEKYGSDADYSQKIGFSPEYDRNITVYNTHQNDSVMCKYAKSRYNSEFKKVIQFIMTPHVPNKNERVTVAKLDDILFDIYAHCLPLE